MEVSSKERAFSDWEPIRSQPGSVHRCCKGTGFMPKPSLGGKLLVWHAQSPGSLRAPINRAWWCPAVIPEHGEWRQEDQKFNAILCYKFGIIQGYMRTCLTKERKKLKQSRSILLTVKGD